MQCSRIQTNAVEPIEVFATTPGGVPATGLSTLVIRVRRQSDGYFLDWNDDTFKASGWTTINGSLTELDATSAPGLYGRVFDTSAITNKAADDIYTVIPDQTSGTTRLPAPGQLYEGGYVDELDAAVSSRATQADILSDATPFDGADVAAILADTDSLDTTKLTSARATALDNLDATISSREAESAAASRAATDVGEHNTTQAAIAGISVPSVSQIADGVWDQTTAGHTGGSTFGALLDGKAEPGDTMALNGSAVSAVADQVWEEALADHASTSGSTAEALDTAQGGADPSAIADAVWDEAIADHLGAGSTGESLNDAGSAASTPAQIADAVWDEALSGHTGAGSAGEAQGRLDVDVSSRAVAGDAMDLIAGAVDGNALDPTATAEIADGVWDEDITGHLGGSSAGAYQSRLDANVSSRAAPGAAMDLVANAIDASAVDPSGAAEIADSVWDEPLAGHAGAGSAGEAQARLDAAVTTRAAPADAMTLTAPTVSGIVDDVWDELQAGHLTAGTMGKSLDDAKATADPSAIADAVWDEPLTGHTGVGSMGQLQSRCDVAVSTRAQPGDPMDLQNNALDAAALDASAVNELVDGVWDEALSGHVGAGTAGAAQNHLDADISTRAAPGDAMDLITDALDSGSLADSARDDIADQVWEEQIGDHSGTVGSTAEALGTVAAPPSAAVIADAVWDEALSGHTGAGSAGEAQGNLDAAVSTRAAPGAAMDLVVDALDAASLATSAAQEIRDEILSDSTPFAGANIDAAMTSRASAADLATLQGDVTAIDGRLPADPASESAQNAQHATTQGAVASLNDLGPTEVENAVWNASQASHVAPGSTGESLNDAGAVADPAAIADAVWDEPAADHTAAGSMGEKQNAADASDQISGAPTSWPPTPGSLLDRLANKDGAQTYDQSTDSLEAVRDRMG